MNQHDVEKRESALLLINQWREIGVQGTHKSGALHEGYQWVYRSPIQRLALFGCHKSRSRKVAEEILDDFSGALQTGGCRVYQNLATKGGILLVELLPNHYEK